MLLMINKMNLHSKNEKVQFVPNRILRQKAEERPFSTS